MTIALPDSPNTAVKYLRIYFCVLSFLHRGHFKSTIDCITLWYANFTEDISKDIPQTPLLNL